MTTENLGRVVTLSIKVEPNDLGFLVPTWFAVVEVSDTDGSGLFVGSGDAAAWALLDLQSKMLGETS